MLKKAGIVVAAVTAGMLAVSPLALAKDHHHDGGINILNIDKNTLQINPQICNNNILDNIVVAVLGKANGKFDSDGKKCKQHNKIDNSG